MGKSENRILLYEDDNSFEKIIWESSAKINQLKILIEKYNALYIGKFTQEVYTKILESGTDFIKEDFEAHTKKQLSNTIKNPALLNGMLRDALTKMQPLFDELNAAYNTLTQKNRIKLHDGTSMYFPLNIISLKKDIPTLDESYLEDARDKYCRVYVDTPEKHEIYRALMHIKAAYQNVLIPAFERIGYSRHHEGLHQLTEVFFKENRDHSLALKPLSIDSALKVVSDYEERLRDQEENSEIARRGQEVFNMNSGYVHTGDKSLEDLFSFPDQRRKPNIQDV